jgi:hypothetical protein
MKTQYVIIASIICIICRMSLAQVDMTVELDKNVYTRNDIMQVSLVIKCINSKSGCILDNRFLERVNSDLYFHFYKTDNLAVNKGLIVGGGYPPMGDSFFFLPASCSVNYKKEINLADFLLHFPDGEYELRCKIPAYKLPEGLDKHGLNLFNEKPFTESLEGSVRFKLIDSKAPASS